MSAYSDWKCGGLTDEQYASACRAEYADEDYSNCQGCEFYKLQRINIFTIRRACTEDFCIKEEEKEEKEND